MVRKNLKKVFLMEQIDPSLEPYEQRVENAVNQIMDGIAEYHRVLGVVVKQNPELKNKISMHMKEALKDERAWGKLGDEIVAMSEKMGPAPKARLPIAKDKQRKVA